MRLVATTLAAVVAALVVAAATMTGAGAARARRDQARATYYLSLGDSLSQGVQPDPAGASLPTGQGYADQLYAALRLTQPGLRLVKLGCNGATTATMMTGGGMCSYPAGSQLAEAVRFLRAHRGEIPLITVDIGANDPESCVTRPSLGNMAGCITQSFPRTIANLTKIMAGLRAAAGANVRIIGMNYYVPALTQWRDGMMGQAYARMAVRLVADYNGLLTAVYRTFDARVADVFGAFHSSDFTDRVTVPGIGSLPRNVAAICLWTWECASAPRGPNEHAKPIGYGVIALAFLIAYLG